MAMHGRMVVLLAVASGCVTLSGPLDEPDVDSSSSETTAPASDDGHSSTVTASTTANGTDPDDGATSGDDAIMEGGGDPSEGTTSGGTTTGATTGVVTGYDTEGKGELLEMCGIEPPDGPQGTGQIQCGCEHCALDWYDVDQALYDAISPQCPCLCEAAGCGGWQGSEATSVDGDEATGDIESDTGDSADSASTTGGNAE